MKVTDDMVRAFVDSLPPVYAFDAPPPSAVREGIAAALRAQPSEPQGDYAKGVCGWISDNDLLKLRESVDDARNIRMSTERTHLRVHPVYIPALADTAPAGNVGGECPCGESTCAESWEPGCGLGTADEFAEVATPQPDEPVAQSRAPSQELSERLLTEARRLRYRAQEVGGLWAETTDAGAQMVATADALEAMAAECRAPVQEVQP